MRLNRTYQSLILLACAAFILGGPGSCPVWAQSANSGVFIDLEVLETLPPAPNPDPARSRASAPARLTDYTPASAPASVEPSPVMLTPTKSTSGTSDTASLAKEEQEYGIHLPPSSLAPVAPEEPSATAQREERALHYISAPNINAPALRPSASVKKAANISPLLPLPDENKETLQTTAEQVIAPLPIRKPKQIKIATAPVRPDVSVARAPVPPQKPAKMEKAGKVMAKKAHFPEMPAVPATEVTEEILASNGEETKDNSAPVLSWADLSETAPLEAIWALAQIKPASGKALPPPPVPQHKPRLVSAPARAPVTATPDTAPQRTLLFGPGAIEITPQAMLKLENHIWSRLTANPHLRLQIKAFASMDAGDTPGDARRLSLARALAVRSWLMEKGIEARRMDIRALGAKSPQEEHNAAIKAPQTGYDGVLLSLIDTDRS